MTVFNSRINTNSEGFRKNREEMLEHRGEWILRRQVAVARRIPGRSLQVRAGVWRAECEVDQADAELLQQLKHRERFVQMH